MELRQLAAFIAVADRLHFGRAADELGVAQPAISQLIRRLEERLGVALFERSSHRVTLTGDGSALLPHARSVVDAAARLNRQAAELAQGTTGVLRFATTPGIGPRLAATIGAFAADHPDTGLAVPVLNTAQKLEGVTTGTLDVAFLRSKPPPDPALLREVVWRERYVALVPSCHPAARCDPVGAAALGELPMLIVDRGAQPVMHDELLRVCAACQLTPRLGPSVRTQQDTFAMIAAGAAWTLYIEGNVPDDVPGVAVRRLPPPDPRSDVWMVWRAVGLSPIAESFVGHVRARSGD